MKLGIFAKTFETEDVDSLFARIKKHEINHVHYNMACSGLPAQPLEIPEAASMEVNRFAKENHIEIVGLSATFNMIHPNPATRKEGLKSLECLAVSCKKMGTNFLSLCSGSRDARDKWKWHPENESADAWRDLLAAMEEAVEIADRHDVLLGVEPEAANTIKDAPTARRLLDEMKSDRIKIIIDPANLFEKAENVDQINYIISQAFDLLKDEIIMAHAKDRTLGKI